jgi:hypothetical protein
MKLIKVVPSNREGKKWMAVFDRTTLGNRSFKLTTHFGARGYEDYTQHKNEERKKRYISRHKKNENWNDPTTAGSLSRWILWNKPTFTASLADFKRRFNL